MAAFFFLLLPPFPPPLPRPPPPLAFGGGAAASVEACAVETTTPALAFVSGGASAASVSLTRFAAFCSFEIQPQGLQYLRKLFNSYKSEVTVNSVKKAYLDKQAMEKIFQPCPTQMGVPFDAWKEAHC